MISVTALSDFFVEVAEPCVNEFDFLRNLTAKAATVSGAASVGLVAFDQQNRVRFVAANNRSGQWLEMLQIQNGEGPCLDCLATGTPMVHADLAHAGDRWPVFASRAVEAGFHSVYAFPMRLRNKVIGALNLFGTQHAHFNSDKVSVVQALADVATIAILRQRKLIQAEVVTKQLQAALNSRIVIEQAKGALAQAKGISPAEAFDLMRARARSHQRLLLDVAQEVLTGSGETVTVTEDNETSGGTVGEPPWRSAGLAPREAEVLALIANGLSNRDIAERVLLSPNTVKAYIRSAYRKIGVERRTQAVLWAVENDFLPGRALTIDRDGAGHLGAA